MAPETRIAGFRIQREVTTVASSKGETRLTPRAMDVLCYLAERRDRLVTRSELLEAFWPGHPGGEDALAHMIREIRVAVDDDGKKQKVIQTIPKKGYRLVSGKTEPRRVYWAASALLLALAAALFVGLSLTAPQEPAFPEASLAVLPFRSLSQDPDAIYFADGLTEEIMNALSSIPQLRVASRTSSFAFRGKDVETRAVAEKLHVTNILEGSVREDNDQLRIIIQLVDALADRQIWTRSYTTSSDNIFLNQTEIAHSIVTALGIELANDEPSTPDFDTDPLVLDFYLRGREYSRLQTRQGYEDAILMFENAVERDPVFAPAWASLAASHTLLARLYDHSPERFNTAEQAAQRAVDLAPLMSEARTALAITLASNDQHENAIREHRRATELGPDNFSAHYSAGITALRIGIFPLAAELFTRAAEIHPADERPLRLLPQVYNRMGDAEKEQETWQRLAALVEQRRLEEPNHPIILASGAAAFQALGDHDRAQEWIDSLLALEPEDAVVLYNVACFFSKARQPSKAISFLTAAYEHGWVEWQWMESDADLDVLRGLPAFQELIADMRSIYASGQG